MGLERDTKNRTKPETRHRNEQMKHKTLPSNTKVIYRLEIVAGHDGHEEKIKGELY